MLTIGITVAKGIFIGDKRGVRHSLRQMEAAASTARPSRYSGAPPPPQASSSSRKFERTQHLSYQQQLQLQQQSQYQPSSHSTLTRPPSSASKLDQQFQQRAMRQVSSLCSCPRVNNNSSSKCPCIIFCSKMLMLQQQMYASTSAGAGFGNSPNGNPSMQPLLQTTIQPFAKCFFP